MWRLAAHCATLRRTRVTRSAGHMLVAGSSPVRARLMGGAPYTVKASGRGGSGAEFHGLAPGTSWPSGPILSGSPEHTWNRQSGAEIRRERLAEGRRNRVSWGIATSGQEPKLIQPRGSCHRGSAASRAYNEGMAQRVLRSL